MDYRYMLLLLYFGAAVVLSSAQHENIPYENVEDICQECACLTAHDSDKRYHYLLSCTSKKFKHILARWPTGFGKNHDNVDIVASFSYNNIELLQQLPATDAQLTFSCRHCGIKNLQEPTFIDVPNIRRLDLSWNEITSDVLTPGVFRGPYRVTHYEPIQLVDLDLSHNKLHTLDKKVFEHTPNLTKLNLSYNELKVLNTPTVMALSSVTGLQELDLSHTAIKNVSMSIFKSLVNLRILNLAGNELTSVPDKLQLIGRSLISLNLAQNPIERFTEESFIGLKSLQNLNISYMPILKTVGKSVFTRLETLRRLDCAHNPKLVEFDMESLLHSSNLTDLDISYCALTAISLIVNVTDKSKTNISSLAKPWTHLHTFVTSGNPWHCNCSLIQTMEYIGAQHSNMDTPARCNTPYFLAGSIIPNLTSEEICSLKIPSKIKVVEEEPPRFLRKRYIMLSVVTAAVVVSIGVMLGFAIAAIRRRLKRDDFGIEPIRYTSVRSSNLSAFSHGNTNSIVVSGNGTTNPSV
ncbi:chondroadherin [Zeugodacus cucurbitae]|uniref:chondroadherin n=1 Tax=Zeugodacus cucurbitae TaxID=28588 RepID=UPI0023D8E42A|nr:chondroadherin [Zeugodacus cucurbitae]XP_011188014.2 chondroadherin [Zeugodacus cucurbitae]XP_054091995.1 chondroadherin [Zeugodacus cucurbitae]XP_054091996.1 chondroadherin [Zeugodacus cucurbitae]XP_054091997.1 chondroadherin [Zeugodacus cucurbitae]